MKEIDIFEELKRERIDKEFYINKCGMLEEQLFKVINELNKTQALLRQFLNENTPSSKLPFKIKINEQQKEPKPRGKPEGSNGGNKEVPESIDEKLSAKLEKRCRRCKKVINRKNIEIGLRFIYDVEIKPIIIEVEEETYLCDCGEFCIAKHPDIPQNGMIGYNLQALFTELKFNFSGSYANISNFFKNEDYAYSDETSWPVNGVRWYLWLLITSNFVFITIQNSRARKVLIDIFGEDYHGGIISDCYRVYDDFARWYQKCWVHLLRKAKFESEKYPAKNVVKLHEQLGSLYREMKDFLKENPSLEIRKAKKKGFEKKLNEIINYKYWCKEAKSIVDNWLIAYRNHWLTALEIEEINLDNNFCERKIRASIGWRKMLGGHRTREGAKQYAIIQTHRMTWKHNGKYPYNELLSVIKN